MGTVRWTLVSGVYRQKVRFCSTTKKKKKVRFCFYFKIAGLVRGRGGTGPQARGSLRPMVLLFFHMIKTED